MFSQKCPNCSSFNISEVTDGNRAVYLCHDCNHKSSYVHQLNGKIIIKDSPHGAKHVTVGAAIERDGKYLLAKRRTFPYRISFVAGHLEYSETPLQGVKREVFEEVGLRVDKAELIYHGDIYGNKCRIGANNHEWYFFKVEADGMPIANNEHEYVNWYSPEELKTLDLGFATRALIERANLATLD